MQLTLDFFIPEALPIEDIDDFVAVVRKVIDKEIGEIDYMVESVIGYDVSVEIQDN